MTVSNFKQIKIILRWSIKASCKLWRTPHNHWSSVPRKYLVSEGKSKIHTKKYLNQIDLTRFGNVWSLQYGQTTTSKTACTHFKHYSCMLHSWNNLISLASERRFSIRSSQLTEWLLSFLIMHTWLFRFCPTSEENSTARHEPSEEFPQQLPPCCFFFFIYTRLQSFSKPNWNSVPMGYPRVKIKP